MPAKQTVFIALFAQKLLPKHLWFMLFA